MASSSISTLSQDPFALNLVWRTGDAVNMRFVIRNADWSGNYIAQVRAAATSPDVIIELDITAVACGTYTEFTIALSEADSLTVPAGKYVWDMVNTDIDLTRLTGAITVSQDVTRP